MATTKKTAKAVPTPMDERETFVSLQKSFAETEQSTQEKLKVLYELQAADVAIDELVLQRGELPAEVAVLEEELAGLKAKTERIGEMIDGYNQTIEAAGKQIVELDAEIEKYRSQLENISNSREFDSINKELENQGLLRAIAEKNIGEARQAIEDRRMELAERALLKTSWNIGRIAAGSGYRNVKTFEAAFRKRHGCSPSEYRRHSTGGA